MLGTVPSTSTRASRAAIGGKLQIIGWLLDRLPIERSKYKMHNG
jgi:hypothetical protein